MVKPGKTTTAVYRAIVRYKRANDGGSPSMRDLMAAAGVTSPSAVLYHLERLESLGLIHRPGGAARSIHIIGAEWRSPLTSHSNRGYCFDLIPHLNIDSEQNSPHFEENSMTDAIDMLEEVIARQGVDQTRREIFIRDIPSLYGLKIDKDWELCVQLRYEVYGDGFRLPDSTAVYDPITDKTLPRLTLAEREAWRKVRGVREAAITLLFADPEVEAKYLAVEKPHYTGNRAHLETYSYFLQDSKELQRRFMRQGG